jgi:hypothetical protein
MTIGIGAHHQRQWCTSPSSFVHITIVITSAIILNKNKTRKQQKILERLKKP